MLIKKLEQIKKGLGKMASKDKTLFENEWLRVRLRDGWYYMWDIPKVNNGVVILVYDLDKNLVLGRYEQTLPHCEEIKLTSITGGIEKGDTVVETALKELEEETGISDVTADDLQELGWVWSAKNSSEKEFLFALAYDSTKKLGEIKGDGSKGEEGAYVKWISTTDAIEKSNSSGISCLITKLALKGVKLI